MGCGFPVVIATALNDTTFLQNLHAKPCDRLTKQSRLKGAEQTNKVRLSVQGQKIILWLERCTVKRL